MSEIILVSLKHQQTLGLLGVDFTFTASTVQPMQREAFDTCVTLLVDTLQKESGGFARLKHVSRGLHHQVESFYTSVPSTSAEPDPFLRVRISVRLEQGVRAHELGKKLARVQERYLTAVSKAFQK